MIRTTFYYLSLVLIFVSLINISLSFVKFLINTNNQMSAVSGFDERHSDKQTRGSFSIRTSNKNIKVCIKLVNICFYYILTIDIRTLAK